MSKPKKVALAYSGGLDTSVIIPWLKENYQCEVVAVCGNIGQGDEELEGLEEKARKTGASEVYIEDMREEFATDYLWPLVRSGAIYERKYLLGTSVARPLLAKKQVEVALKTGCDGLAHGATGKGNDQVRFEVTLRTINPQLEVLAPVRDQSFVRPEQIAYLEKHDYPIPAKGTEYSINRGLWGVSIGGQETLDSHGTIPEHAWVLSPGALEQPKTPETHVVGFSHGIPVSLDGNEMGPVALIEKLESLAGVFGIGRGIHVGDTVLGTKGRVAFEAPAAEVLLTAHRELEKLTLTALQTRIKDSVAASYGDFVHEGKQLDAACRDIEALLESSQRLVTGDVKVQFRAGSVFIEGRSEEHTSELQSH